MIRRTIAAVSRAALPAAAALLAASVIATAPSCSKQEKKTEEQSSQVTIERRTGPPGSLELKGLDGTSVRLDSFKGHFVVVTFWATWSKDSAAQLAALNPVYSRYRRWEVPFVAIAVGSEGESAIKGFLAKNLVQMPVYVNGDEVAKAFGGYRKLPTSFILMRDGKVYTKVVGLQPGNYFDKALNSLFAQRL